jgi:hypothetical protein
MCQRRVKNPVGQGRIFVGVQVGLEQVLSRLPAAQLGYRLDAYALLRAP